jgi:hypothetical protein
MGCTSGAVYGVPHHNLWMNRIFAMAVEQVDGRRGKMRKKRWIPEDIRPFNGAETGYRRNKPGLTATQPSHGRWDFGHLDQ